MNRNPSSEVTPRRSLTRLAWVAAWTGAATPVIDATPIIRVPATTTSADADIMMAGGLVDACNDSNATLTANKEAFTGMGGQRGRGTGVSLNLVRGGGARITLNDHNTHISGGVEQFSTEVFRDNATTPGLRFRRRRGAETASGLLEDKGSQKPIEAVSAAKKERA